MNCEALGIAIFLFYPRGIEHSIACHFISLCFYVLKNVLFHDIERHHCVSQFFSLMWTSYPEAWGVAFFRISKLFPFMHWLFKLKFVLFGPKLCIRAERFIDCLLFWYTSTSDWVYISRVVPFLNWKNNQL